MQNQDQDFPRQGTSSSTTSRSGDSRSQHASLEALREQARAVGYELRALGRASVDAAEQELGFVKRRGRSAVDSAKERADEWEHRTARGVQERPLRALAYAAGVGVLLGLFFRR